MNHRTSISYKLDTAQFYWDVNEEGRECLVLIHPNGNRQDWLKSDAYFGVKLSAATKEMLKLGWKIDFIDKPSNEETELDKIKKFRNMS